MADPPEVDGRRREALRHHVQRIAPAYTEEWDPTSDGPGTALAALFAELAEDVVERLDQVPEKHRIAFFDRLGFDRRPPQPARVPLSFEIADGAGRNVVVPTGTQAVAKAADGRPEQTFEVATDDGFEATPANLTAVYSVDPAVDAIYDHWSPPDAAGLEQGAEATLFAGTNVQAHRLYIGHADQLTVQSDDDGENGGPTIRVQVETDEPASTIRHEFGWQYYGERVDETGEPQEGWHMVPGRTPALRISRLQSSGARRQESASAVVPVDLTLDGTLTETTVNGVESLWVRAVVPAQASTSDLLDVEIGPAVAVGPGPQDAVGVETLDEGNSSNTEAGTSARTLAPDRLLYNDVPLPFATDEADDSTEQDRYLPLGTAPQAQDTFYVASDEAFTKTGVRVELSFTGLDGAVTSTDTPPELSWEYYDGNGWSKLSSLTDDTEKLTGDTSSTNGVSGTAVLTVPDDLSKTAVAGHEHHWIRVRMAGGTYGKRTATGSSTSWEANHEINPPEFDDLTIRYLSPDDGGDGAGNGDDGTDAPASALPSEPATHLFAENGLAFGDNLADAEATRVRPFERLPDDDQTLYLGFDARLHGGPLTLFFDIADQAFEEFFHSRVRWEYCADPATDEWVRLDTQDGTEGLTEQGIVRLVFPSETDACPRFGATHHWIRARVTGDPFVPEGRESTGTADGLGAWVEVVGEEADLPVLSGPGQLVSPESFAESVGMAARSDSFGSVGVQSSSAVGGTGSMRAYLWDAGGSGANLLPDGSGGDPADFRRFTAVNWSADTDAPTANTVDMTAAHAVELAPVERVDRTVTHAVDMSTASIADMSTASIADMSATNLADMSATNLADMSAFEPVDLRSATVVGVVGYTVEPVDLVAASAIDIFSGGLDIAGFEDAWIPLEPVEDGFQVPMIPRLPTAPVPPTDIPPCERTLPTTPPMGDPSRRPPTVETLAPNTTWLDNVRSVTGETLGSSDGSQSQTFAVTSPPVVDETVWVDEAATLSAGGRQSLEAAETPSTEAVTTPDGQLQSFWVAWTQVSDFLDSGEDERHYTVDRVEGQITFGDGVAGRIPPRGENNVRIDYRTGGGTDGNVASGAVAGLKSSLQFVDSVANPAPGTGGADAESTDRVLTRAPRELRDRDRAVTEADYERVALDAARKVSRAACIPEMNTYGESAPGWVTLIIVPNSPSTTPTPSTGLKAQVEAAVSDRAPATLVAADRLVVRGPSYVAVSVEVTLTAVSSGSVATLEESVTDAIAAFLHPLSGGPMDDRAGDEGWPFGELPTLSDLYALIEGVEGVDYVEQLAVQYDPDTNETTATVTEGEEPPRVSPDALVHSGVHDVTVRLESDPGDDRTSEGS